MRKRTENPGKKLPGFFIAVIYRRFSDLYFLIFSALKTYKTLLR